MDITCSKCCLGQVSDFTSKNRCMPKLLFFLLRGEKSSIFTEFEILKWMISDCGEVLHSLLNYNNFRMAWYSYLELLDIYYNEGFRCSHCRENPNIVIMDATSLAFRKELDCGDLFLPPDRALPLISGR